MSSEVITKNDLKAIFDEVMPSTLPATSVSATQGSTETTVQSLLDSLGICYVKETGMDNSWNYKKWSDGTFEAWGQFNATGLTLNTASAGTYYNSTSGVKNFALPSFTSTISIVLVKEIASMSSGIWIYTAQRNGSNLQVDYRAHASTSSGVCNGCYYIRGTW